jgi:uncharacterized repeat protein (TIGR01451 family)
MVHRWRGRRLARRLVPVSALLLSGGLGAGPAAVVAWAGAADAATDAAPTMSPVASGRPRSTGAPDLEVHKTSDAADEVRPGDAITYTILARNAGDLPAHDVEISDTFPDGLRYAGGPPPIQGGGCTVASSLDQSGNETLTLYCTIDVLPAGASATVAVPLHVQPDAPCGAMTNDVSISAADEPRQAVDAGNSARVIDQVACSCGVRLVTSAHPTEGRPGDPIAYTYTVTDTGNAVLSRVAIEDDVLGHVGHLLDLRPGHTRTLTARTTLPAHGVAVRNTATATATAEGGETCSARGPASVTVVKAAGGGPANPDTGTGGTAFTGVADAPLAAAIVLAALGLVAVSISRRRPV